MGDGPIRLLVATAGLGCIAAEGSPGPIALAAVGVVGAFVAALLRRKPVVPRPSAPLTPTRAEVRAWVRKAFAQLGLGNIAQRADRAFAKAEKAEARVAASPIDTRPLAARLDAFDASANQLVTCLEHRGAWEEALSDLERVASSLERQLTST